MNKGRVAAIGCKTEEQHRHSDLMLINGVCCLWLSCQQITRCPKINHVSCVGLQPRWLGFTLPRGIARAGAVFRQLALLGSAQRGRIWRSTKEKCLKRILSFLFLVLYQKTPCFSCGWRYSCLKPVTQGSRSSPFAIRKFMSLAMVVERGYGGNLGLGSFFPAELFQSL